MLRIGDKVIPISKTCLGGLDDSNRWARAKEKNQTYMYIVGITYYCRREVYILSDIMTKEVEGDYFYYEDIVPYILNKGR